jgi:hypothetical protein
MRRNLFHSMRERMSYKIKARRTEDGGIHTSEEGWLRYLKSPEVRNRSRRDIIDYMVQNPEAKYKVFFYV